MDFFTALLDPRLSFLWYAVLTGLLSSLAFGIMGTWVVVRNISSIAGAVSHTVLAGIGFSLWLRGTGAWQDFPPILREIGGLLASSPLVGAMVAGVFSALLIGWISLHGSQRDDSVINAIWAVGMAVGILFIAKTPGYADPMTWLFGNILLTGPSDLYMVAALDLVVIILGVIFYRPLMAVTFDEEFSRVRGLPAGAYYYLLLVLTALTVVLLVSVVGIIMVIALLTIPTALAGLFSKKIWHMMVGSSLVTMVASFSGMVVSYQADLPSGAIIILMAAGLFTLGLILRALGSKKLPAAKK